MSLRRVLYPLRLVLARLAAGGERLVLVSVGVVAGAAVLAAVLGGRLVMQDRALSQATAQLPADQRTTEVTWFGGYGGTWNTLNRFVTPAMRSALGVTPTRAMLFREASIEGRLVNLRAADDLDRYVTLLSGRMPSVCKPSHCEVLRLKGKGPIPSTKYLNLIEVGRAVLKPGTPFAPFVLPAPQTQQVARAVNYHTPPPSPIVIANGVAGLTRTQELATFGRVYAWTVSVPKVHPWRIGDYERSVSKLTAAIQANSDQFQVTAPTVDLETAAASSRSASRRLLLLGGEGGALLLAFTILAAAALRRDVTDARRRLTWFGARRWQVELFTLFESLALAGAGTILGWVAGGAVASLIASRAGSPAWDVVSHALLTPGGILAALAIAAAAGLLLYATVRAPAVQVGRLALTPLDAAALGAIAVVLVGWARGSVDASQLQGSGGTSAFLLLVPALIVFAAAVIAARLLAPALRAIGRAGRRGPIALRLAAASLARNPGHAAIAATFLVASLGLALFAVAYRATLIKGQNDEAAYAVPAPYVLAEDLRQLVPVLHAVDGTKATQILRLTGNVPSGTPFAFLALPSDKLGAVGGWRSDFSSSPRATLAARITPSSTMALRTVALPPGRDFTLPVSTSGEDVGVQAFFRGPVGDSVEVSLGRTHGMSSVVLHARTPFRHARLAQLRINLVGNLHQAANGGTGIQPSAKGILTLGTPRVNGRAVERAFAGWVGTGGVSGAATRIGYLITPDRNAVYRPAQPTDRVKLAVLATPHVAAEAGPHGVIPLQIEGELVAARIVGVIHRFPSVDGDAVVADLQSSETLLETRSPGLGLTDELWVDGPPPAGAKQLSVTSRADTLARLQADPLARGALLTLAGTAAVALLLALIGLLLAVVGDVRDERGELFDLEAQGASPATIRAHLRLRALLVAAFGIVGGIALGAILTSLVISLVAVTASAAEPQPPLRLALDVPVLAIAAVVYVVVAAALVAFATRMRGHAPPRASEAVA
ncbi:MAG TPA: ABC transporter permease [Gaiellaceae bacterium]|nr:ABC transporter permease [Gaiellaceae bacterium]